MANVNFYNGGVLRYEGRQVSAEEVISISMKTISRIVIRRTIELKVEG